MRAKTQSILRAWSSLLIPSPIKRESVHNTGQRQVWLLIQKWLLYTHWYYTDIDVENDMREYQWTREYSGKISQ